MGTMGLALGPCSLPGQVVNISLSLLVVVVMDDSLCGPLDGGQELSLGGGIGPSIAVATVIRGIGGGGVDICL